MPDTETGRAPAPGGSEGEAEPAQATVEQADAGAPPRSRPAHWHRDAVILGVVALALRLPALLAERHHNYDDGAFGLSAMAMREGYLPFKDIFSSQGPLFLPLVWVSDHVGLHALWAPRLVATASGVAATVAVYAAGRRLTGRPNAVFAAVLVMTSGTMLRVTGPLTADGVAVAFATLAFAAALAYDERPSKAMAGSVAALAVAAVSVKLLVGAVAIPIVIILWRHRRRGDIATAVGTGTVVLLACWLPFGLGRVIDQSVTYHSEAHHMNSMVGNVGSIVVVLFDRDPLVVVTLLVGAVALVASRRAYRRQRASGAGSAAPWTYGRSVQLVLPWFVVSFVALVLEPTLFTHHMSVLIAPACLLGVLGITRAAAKYVALGALVAVPWQAIDALPVLHPPPYNGSEAHAHAELLDLPDGAWVISDAPGMVWWAGLSSPPDLVDPSIKRIEQGRVTTRSVLDQARDPRVCALLAWRPKFGWLLPGLGDGLEQEGFVEASHFGPITQPSLGEVDAADEGNPSGLRTLWVKPDCSP